VTVANAGPDQAQCNSGSFTLAGNAATSGVGAWAVVSGTATITDPSLYNSGVTAVPANSTATLSWTIVNGTCSSTDNVSLTNNAAPGAPTGTAAQSFCPGATVADLTATGTAIQWYATSSGGSPLATSTALTTATHYYASQTINGCESTSRFDVTVTLFTQQWIGGPSGIWEVAGNWCPGIPTSSTDVEIPSGVTITVTSSSAVCHNLTIDAGAHLIILTGQSINISGTVTLK